MSSRSHNADSMRHRLKHMYPRSSNGCELYWSPAKPSLGQASSVSIRVFQGSVVARADEFIWRELSVRQRQVAGTSSGNETPCCFVPAECFLWFRWAKSCSSSSIFGVCHDCQFTISHQGTTFSTRKENTSTDNFS